MILSTERDKNLCKHSLIRLIIFTLKRISFGLVVGLWCAAVLQEIFF